MSGWRRAAGRCPTRGTLVGLVAVVGLLGGPATVVRAAPVAAGPVEAAQGTAAWTHEGYGPTNTHYNATETRINRSTVGSLRQRWTAATPATEDTCTLQNAPLVSGGLLFTSAPTGIAAHDAATGARRWMWEFPLRGEGRRNRESFSHMAVAGGLVLVLTRPCAIWTERWTYLTALDARTGASRWRVRRDLPHAALVAEGGVAVIGNVYDGAEAVTAFRVTDGSRLWRRAGFRLRTGVSARGRLLLTRADGRAARAVTIGSGRTLWERPCGWDVAAADPAGDRFIVRIGDDGLAAVAAGTGALRWRTRHAGAFALDGRRLHLAYRRSVETYDAATGRKLHTNHQPDHAGQPVRAGGLLYVALGGGNPMAILDPPTGRTIATFAASRYITASPVVVGGWLYITDGETMRAYAP